MRLVWTMAKKFEEGSSTAILLFVKAGGLEGFPSSAECVVGTV